MGASSDLLMPCRQLSRLDAELRGLADPARAPRLARRIGELGRGVVAAGLDGVAASRLISGLNDRLTGRLVELTAGHHRLPPVAWCWLAFGSEGRQEQTFVTDQDNGLVFHAADSQEAAALRALFLPFAEEVNGRLADCGLALCAGRVMAGNPEWCLSLDEWRNCFIDWVRRPEPRALLNASIFFDLRPLCGATGLGEELRRVLLTLTADAPAFLHLMAANALLAEVPLNFRGELATDAQGEVDLKKFGSRIFVDAARIFALAAGAPAVNTADRLRRAGPAAGLQADETAAAEAAFAQLLRLRLTHQAEAGAGHALNPAVLHEFDRAMLREALKQARRLQQRLKLNYAL